MDKRNEIELLQAQLVHERALVQDLEAGKSRMILDAIEIGGQFSDLREAVRVLKEALQFVMLKAPGYDWNTDPLSITLMVGNALTKSDHVLAGEPDEENYSLQAQLAQRTAELEAAKQHLREGEEAYHKVGELNDHLKAELERVRGELVEATHNVNVYQSLYSTGCMDRALLENELRDIRTLILALPKVEGEIAVSANQDGWYIMPLLLRCVTKDQADSIATLLQHRQGMEG